MAFNLDDYEPVAVRLQRWLDMDHGTCEPSVRTFMVSEPSSDICVFRAELWQRNYENNEEFLISTGWAEEVRGSGNVNRTSHVENCETSAVGRALANAGMAGTDVNKRPSREEMSKVQRATTAPRPPSDMASANGVTVRGTQHGPLPDWLVLDAFQAGVSEVYDNRDQVAGTKRPWFKATTGGKDAKAFWPPKGTPDPVIDLADDYGDDGLEEPF